MAITPTPPKIAPEVIARAKRISKGAHQDRPLQGLLALIEFDERIAKVLPAEDHEAAWMEYLNVEHGHFWFYDDGTDSWQHE